jgi:hypothetical protein
MPAGPFAVTIALDGVEAGRATVAGLAPGATTTALITAPRMPVERLTAMATLE